MFYSHCVSREQDWGLLGSLLSQELFAHVGRWGDQPTALTEDPAPLSLKGPPYPQLLRICICFPFQVCHLHGPKNWSKSVCPSRRPGWSEPQNGHDGVCLPHGERDEEGVRPREQARRWHGHPWRSAQGAPRIQRTVQAIPKSWTLETLYEIPESAYLFGQVTSTVLSNTYFSLLVCFVFQKIYSPTDFFFLFFEILPEKKKKLKSSFQMPSLILLAIKGKTTVFPSLDFSNQFYLAAFFLV